VEHLHVPQFSTGFPQLTHHIYARARVSYRRESHGETKEYLKKNLTGYCPVWFNGECKAVVLNGTWGC